MILNQLTYEKKQDRILQTSKGIRLFKTIVSLYNEGLDDLNRFIIEISSSNP
jgi:hypothetical protein